MTVDLMEAALRVAEDALAAGELPIGAVDVLSGCRPNAAMDWYRLPALHGPTRRSECRDLFRRYVDTMPDSGFRRWASFTASDA